MIISGMAANAKKVFMWPNMWKLGSYDLMLEGTVAVKIIPKTHEHKSEFWDLSGGIVKYCLASESLYEFWWCTLHKVQCNWSSRHPSITVNMHKVLLRSSLV